MPTGFKCPCCQYLTLSEEPPGTFEICPVCRWEDDNVQYNDPDSEGGANSVSLKKARENYLTFGAKTELAKSRARKPLPDELP